MRIRKSAFLLATSSSTKLSEWCSLGKEKTYKNASFMKYSEASVSIEISLERLKIPF